VIDDWGQLYCLNESGMVKVLERRCFGIDWDWKRKEEKGQNPCDPDA
jgi:hypothetical protein